MLGADVGTALMAKVFSLDLRWLSPLLIIVGVIIFLPRKSSRAGQLGRVALGLGLIILALQLVVQATQPITQAQGVKVIFASLSGDILLDMLIGVLFTLVSWSSLSVVLLTAAFVAASLISVPVALSLVLGRQPRQRPAGAAGEPAHARAPAATSPSATCSSRSSAA